MEATKEKRATFTPGPWYAPRVFAWWNKRKETQPRTPH
jgi:hypothetical protein